MNWTTLAAGLLVAVVVVGGLGGVAYTDLAPLDSSQDADRGSETERDSDGGGDPGTDSDLREFPADDDGETTSGEPFAFRIEAIDNCGETCRDVTATIENTGNDAADGVTVRTQIYAGENSTDDRVWDGTEDVGSLAAGESYTTTQRVELSLGDAFAVQQQDGWITIVTTIESEEETVTISRSRQVA